MSDTTLLSAVNTAIEAIVTGQVASYSLDGVSYTYHNLADLWNIKIKLEKNVNAASGDAVRIQTTSFLHG